MMRVTLKVDVDTLRGTLEGVPRLTELLQRLGVPATLLFSLGPDHTGRALRRLFRPGFLKKVLRTSVGANYGFKTLCYGTLIPGPDIGRRGAEVMRRARDAGLDVGIHCWDHFPWQDCVMHRGEDWVQREMGRAASRFQEIFHCRARVHGAPGWRISPHVLKVEERLGFLYCSDTRGTHPFFPAVGGERFGCPQLPTTLPTLDELLGVNGLTEDNAAEHLVQLSRTPLPHGHVFTLHAELEGMRYRSVFSRLLTTWLEEGFTLSSLDDLYGSLDLSTLPVHRVVMGEIPGRTGTIALQGEPLPSTAPPG
jgi:undecaprenyl phosphate-alpha-L-ara4FN deformylase